MAPHWEDLEDASSDRGAGCDTDGASDAGLCVRGATVRPRRLTIVAIVLAGCVFCAGPALIAISVRTGPPTIVSDPRTSPSAPSPPLFPHGARRLLTAAAPPLMRYPVPSIKAQPPSASSPATPAPPAPSARAPSHLLSRAPPPPSSPSLFHLNRRAVLGSLLTKATTQVPIPPALMPHAQPLPSAPLLLIAHLNRRFVAGAPSESLFEAGVVVHVLDGYEKSDAPWTFDPSSPTGDRASASIVNARHPDIYENLLRPVGFRRLPGFVLADSPTRERLSCSYSREGGTNGCRQNCDHSRNNSNCVPGCTVKECQGGEAGVCFFSPGRLKEMLETHDRQRRPGHHSSCSYNEVCLPVSACVSWLEGGAACGRSVGIGCVVGRRIRSRHIAGCTPYGPTLRHCSPPLPRRSVRPIKPVCSQQ